MCNPWYGREGPIVGAVGRRGWELEPSSQRPTQTAHQHIYRAANWRTRLAGQQRRLIGQSAVGDGTGSYAGRPLRLLTTWMATFDNMVWGHCANSRGNAVH
ncbi:hypothetical protein NP493_723g01038 [Ridgeia piscesae]|uniref:Uncharacterized protein n=1 Tax=Ridgeia piscesae TaxID=27915 RepID=A0AAD9NP67_RIDPI|nr:hypothetical protein NP493_723g01038 [Ridgeia piscesae]